MIAIKWALPLASITLLLAGCGERSPATTGPPNEVRVERVLGALASDAMRGRAAFSPDAMRAAEVIAWKFKSIGIEPVAGETGFFQAFSVYVLALSGADVAIDIVSLPVYSTGAFKPVEMTGTSMATPHVAGAAALYLSQFPSATPAEVLTAIQDYAKGGVKLTGDTVDRTVWVGDF